MSEERRKIPWESDDLVLEHVNNGVAVEYVGAAATRDGKKIQDGFSRLILVGEEKKAHYVDDCGAMATSRGPVLLVRERRPPPAPAQGVRDRDELAAMSAAIDHMREAVVGEVGRVVEEVRSLRKQTLEMAQFFVKATEAITKTADHVKACADACVAAKAQVGETATESQKALLDVGTMLVEELRATMARFVEQVVKKSEGPAAEPEPPRKVVAMAPPRPALVPPPPRPDPIPAAKKRIAGEHDKLSRIARKQVERLLDHPDVMTIVVGESCRRQKGVSIEGMIRVKYQQGHGFLAVVQTADHCRELYVTTRDGTEHGVMSWLGIWDNNGTG